MLLQLISILLILYCLANCKSKPSGTNQKRNPSKEAHSSTPKRGLSAEKKIEVPQRKGVTKGPEGTLTLSATEKEVPPDGKKKDSKSKEDFMVKTKTKPKLRHEIDKKSVYLMKSGDGKKELKAHNQTSNYAMPKGEDNTQKSIATDEYNDDDDDTIQDAPSIKRNRPTPSFENDFSGERRRDGKSKEKPKIVSTEKTQR